jgi:chromosome segregation ATPase
MKTGEVAKILRVDRKTISNWIDDYGLEEVFSPGARGLEGNIQRDLNQADLVALNTIRILRSKNVNWNEIKERLKRGEWETEFPSNVTGADHLMISAEQRQATYTIETIRERDVALAQRDAALAEVTQLEEEVERIKESDAAKQRRIEELLREAGDIERLREADAAKEKRIDDLNEELKALNRQVGEVERLRNEIERLRGDFSSETENSAAESKEKDKRIEELVIQLTKLQAHYEFLKEKHEAKENPRDNL